MRVLNLFILDHLHSMLGSIVLVNLRHKDKLIDSENLIPCCRQLLFFIVYSLSVSVLYRPVSIAKL